MYRLLNYHDIVQTVQLQTSPFLFGGLLIFCSPIHIKKEEKYR